MLFYNDFTTSGKRILLGVLIFSLDTEQTITWAIEFLRRTVLSLIFDPLSEDFPVMSTLQNLSSKSGVYFESLLGSNSCSLGGQDMAGRRVFISLCSILAAFITAVSLSLFKLLKALSSDWRSWFSETRYSILMVDGYTKTLLGEFCTNCNSSNLFEIFRIRFL